MRRFTLLSRPDCHLCEEFEAEVMAAFGDRIEIEAVQVDQHPHWRAEYGRKIPVLLDAQDRFICAVVVDIEAIAAALAST